MGNTFHRGEFDADDLVKVDESKCVILASGGPLLDLICIEGDQALVQSRGPERERFLFPVVCLRRLIKLEP